MVAMDLAPLNVELGKGKSIKDGASCRLESILHDLLLPTLTV